MVLVGHFTSQTVQPIHLSVMKWGMRFQFTLTMAALLLTYSGVTRREASMIASYGARSSPTQINVPDGRSLPDVAVARHPGCRACSAGKAVAGRSVTVSR